MCHLKSSECITSMMFQEGEHEADTHIGNSSNSLSQPPVASKSPWTTAEKSSFFLNRSYYGLYIPRMVWRELQNFSSGFRLPGASFRVL